jgi:hypothetical protein
MLFWGGIRMGKRKGGGALHINIDGQFQNFKVNFNDLFANNGEGAPHAMK